MKKGLLSSGVVLWLVLFGSVSQAEELLMVRARLPFAESMLALQEAIGQEGYVVSRVQRVDIGLTESGFQTDKYRVVFLGKPEQTRALSRDHPTLIPYLPLKIAIFAEGDETLLVASNPRQLSAVYSDPRLQPVFATWSDDMRAILERVRNAE